MAWRVGTKMASQGHGRHTYGRLPLGWQVRTVGAWIVLIGSGLFATSAMRAADVATAEQANASSENAKPDAIQAGHSYHGEAFNEGPRQAAYTIPGTGNVRFPKGSATSEAVNVLLHQGVGQLHGFWYFEAERTFRQAASLERDCAAAYWGIAMANANNRDRAKKFLDEAIKRKETAPPHIRMYIDALAALLKEDDEKKASQTYVKALESILYEHPDDIEAKAFLALHLWQRRNSDQPLFSHLAVDSLIDQVLAVEPMHPVHHYRIHLWDDEKPARALPSAALCGQSAPGIAHMWHMPGHTYSNLHRYEDAVWQQEASARVDHAQMMRDRLLPDQIHNFAHNNEWLIRNLLHIGRIPAAVDLAKNMIELPRHPKMNVLSRGGCSSSYGRERLIQVLTAAELWDEALSLSQTPYFEPTAIFNEEVRWHLLVGRSHYALGHVAEGDAQLASLAERYAKKQSECQVAKDEARSKAEKESKSEEDTKKAIDEAGGRFNDELERAKKAVLELETLQAIAQDRWADALQKAQSGADLNAAQWSRLFVKNGQPEQAVEKLREEVKNHPQATLPLAHLAHLYWQLGRLTDARETFEQLRRLSAQVDLQAPPYARLAPLAHQQGLPRDWRPAVQVAADVGVRPSLDSLGPFRWRPQPAVEWSLPGASGQSVSLTDYRGRAVLVLFYLGHGCLHCAEQLQAFGPQAEAFRSAGIELVAISSDDLDGLAKSIETYQGGLIPFPLLSDHSLSVFRQYRAFDDFENQPLHGTFLIDGQGMLRWHDIGFEPFMDHAFVLEEAKRLLQMAHP